MKQNNIISCLLFFIYSIIINASFAQTTYTFSALGSSSGGFKTVTTSPSGSNIVISDNMTFYSPIITVGVASTNSFTCTIKGDGLNTETFTFDDMLWRPYSGSRTLTNTQIVFKDASGYTIDTWTLSADYQIPLSFNSEVSAKTIFGEANSVSNVAEVIITADLGGSANSDNIEFLNITLSAITAPSTNTAPVIGGTVAGQNVNDNSTISPFSSITTTDADGDNLSATITLDDNAKGVLSGTGLSGSGPYTIASTTPADLQATLRALSFNPTDNSTATSETTTFTVVVNDDTDTHTDNTTTVISNAVAPTVIDVTVPSNATYIAGHHLDFTVNFNENVTVNTTGGVPQIAITIGATTRQANYINGSGTNAIIFRYTIQSGDLDTNGIAVGSLAANGGTLKDAGGKDANLTLNSVGSTNAVLVDAVPPSGYTVQIDQTDVNASNETAISFTFSAAEVGTTYNYTISSDNGGTSITGSGSIATSNQQITNIDVSSLNDGTLTVSVNLTDNAGNIGSNTTDTTIKNTAIAYTPDINNILYVNKNVSGGDGSGDSWANAVPELADALLWARTQYDADNNWLQNDSLQVFVAKGTYKPLYNAADGNYTANGNRDNAFVMVKNVQLYGGFAGSEANLSDRDLSITVNATVLSGDIGGLNDFSDNVYHVVVGAGNMGAALLDGFTITGGNANDNASSIAINANNIRRDFGGGIHNSSSSSSSLTNVTITGNIAGNAGGGMYNSSSSSSSSLTNVSIAENTAASGGGMYNFSSSPNLTNVTIAGNTATYDGGGMYNFSSSPDLTNVTITGNTAAHSGGEMYNDNSPSLTINNSIVWGEISDTYGLGYIVNYSLIQDNTNTANGNIDATGISEIDVFTDPANGDYTLKYTSLAVNAGNNSLYLGDLQNDLDLLGNARLYNDTAIENDVVDIGAYEYSSDLPAPVAGFSLNPANGCVTPHTVFFTDESQQPDIWEWDFGDGSTSTVQNPTHTYTAQGEYTVTLKVTDTIFNTFDTHTDVVTVQLPTVDFTTTVPNVCTPQTITFTDATVFSGGGSNSAWEWDFGDGHTSTAQNPEHTYAASGTYTVSFTITTDMGCNFTKTSSVTVNDPLSASVTITDVSCNGGSDGAIDVLSVTGGTAPYTYTLDNLATGVPITGLTAGTYSVTVTDVIGCTDTASVTVTEPDLLIASVVATDVSCNGANDGAVDLTVTGGTAPYTYLWDNGATTEDMTGLATGNYSVTVTDANGCTATATATIENGDTTAPTPDQTTLADITMECEVLASDVINPTATDNCGGSVTVTNDVTFPITSQGTTIITWSYEDENGNTSTQTQNVVIDDVTAPVADQSTLANITAECEVLATDVTAPTATDNCGGMVSVTNDASFPISTQGTTVITWSYEDVNGNISTQTQNVVIDDVTAPVADQATLADITMECEVLASDVINPTATDNCGGTVTVTNDATFPISTQGTTVITWSYEDENGNISMQTQNVVIDDVTAPVADQATLADITMECEVLASDVPVPTATDNCGGTVTVTNDASFPISTQGTTLITWTYEDENGNTSTQTQNINVLVSPIAGVTFDDATVTYDGSVHTIAVNNLPTDASVSYSTAPSTGTPNGTTDAGIYTITAIVTPPVTAVNCDPITLTATLTIDQAPQTIDFDALPVMMLEDDPDFQLQATASSGLPVEYTYTYTAANPPATVTPEGWVSLLTSGSIDITAAQPGNSNYLPAIPVTQTLQINSRDASAHSVNIAGVTYDEPESEIYYLIECSDDQDQVSVDFETETNATVNPSHNFTMETPTPGIYRQEVLITSQDGSTTQTYMVVIEKMFPFFEIVEQKFDNVVLVNNNPTNNGGYRFVDYEWFKDGQFLGNEQYYSAGPNTTDNLDPDADYYVRMELENGDILQTCIGNVTLVHDFSASIFPNPNESGKQLNIEIYEVQISAENPLAIQLYSLQGIEVGNWRTNRNITTINLPETLAAGVYIVKCTAGRNIRTFKLIIE